MQGWIRYAYPCPAMRHLLFHFPSAQAGGRFLSELLPLVTNAEPAALTLTQMLNVGITADGLRELDVPVEVIDEFPADFLDGPDPVTQGDVGCSAPAHWWNQRFKTQEIHAVVHLFARSENRAAAEIDRALDDATATVRSAAALSGVVELRPWLDDSAFEGRSLGD